MARRDDTLRLVSKTLGVIPGPRAVGGETNEQYRHPQKSQHMNLPAYFLATDCGVPSVLLKWEMTAMTPWMPEIATATQNLAFAGTKSET